MDIDKALNIEELRGRFLEHTRRAYSLLPALEQPRILDIGCGQGQQTMELANLSGGEVVGIDIDHTVLSKLQQRIDGAKIGDRVKIFHASLFDNPFNNSSFDILWEEGVLHLLDASRSFGECRRLLKPDGHLVMHETILWFESNRNKLMEFGFKLTDNYMLPKRFWWTHYGAPLEERIKAYRDNHGGTSDSERLTELDSVVASIKNDPDGTDCGIYLLKKGS